ATFCACASAVATWRYPTTGIACCCARAPSGHAVAPTISDMNSRLLIAASKPQDKALYFAQAQLLLEMDVGERLPVGVADDEAAFGMLVEHPWRSGMER